MATDGNIHVMGVRSFNTVFVVGLLPNGQINTAYGTNGITVVPGSTDLPPSNAVRRPDGTFIVSNQNAQHAQLHCLDNDGAFVTTFGNNGSIVPEPGSDPHYISWIRALPDGSLLGAGALNIALPADPAIFSHYHSDGSLDTSFGTNGNLLLALVTLPGTLAMDIGSDGTVLTVVNSRIPTSPCLSHMVRFNGPGVGITELANPVEPYSCASGTDAFYVTSANLVQNVTTIGISNILGQRIEQVSLSGQESTLATLHVPHSALLPSGCYALTFLNKDGQKLGGCAVVKE